MGGHRVYIAGFRVHHGWVGCVLTLVGVVLAGHDRGDWRDWWPTRQRKYVDQDLTRWRTPPVSRQATLH